VEHNDLANEAKAAAAAAAEAEDRLWNQWRAIITDQLSNN